MEGRGRIWSPRLPCGTRALLAVLWGGPSGWTQGQACLERDCPSRDSIRPPPCHSRQQGLQTDPASVPSPQAPPRDPDSGPLLLTSPADGPGDTCPSLRRGRAGQATCPGDLTGCGVQKNNVLGPEQRHCHLSICKQKPQTRSCQMRGVKETQGTEKGGAAGRGRAGLPACVSLRSSSTFLYVSK